MFSTLDPEPDGPGNPNTFRHADRGIAGRVRCRVGLATTTETSNEKQASHDFGWSTRRAIARALNPQRDRAIYHVSETDVIAGLD